MKLYFVSTVILHLGLTAALQAQSNQQIRGELAPLTVDSIRVQKPTEAIIPAIRQDAEAWKNLPKNRLGDVIKRLPGVFVTGGSEEKDLRFRGLDKEFSRTQVGAFPIPDGGEKRELQLDRVPTGMVGSVELLRMATSEYESDGLAGRLVVNPKQIPKEFTFDIRSGIGSRQGTDGINHRTDLLIAGPANEHFGYLGSLHQVDDSFGKEKLKTTFKNGNRTNQDTENEEKRFRSNDAYFDFQWVEGRHQFNVRPLLLDQEEEKTKTKSSFDFTKPIATDQTFETEEETKIKRSAGSAFSHLYVASQGWATQTDAAWYRLDEAKPDKVKKTYKERLSVLTFDNRNDENEDKVDETFNLASKFTLPIEAALRQELRTGFSLRTRDRERVKSVFETKANGSVSNKTKPKDTYFLDENYYAVFAQNQIWLNDRFSVLPGVRIEKVDLQTRDAGTFEGDSSQTSVNPHLHSLYQISPEWNLSGAIGKVVSRPKFDELSPYEEETSSSFITGNPELDPTEAVAVELGAQQAKGSWKMGINLFYRDITNLIESVDTGVDRAGKDVIQIQNVGDGYTYGAEVDFRYQFDAQGAPWLALWSNHSVFESELTDSTTGQKRRFKEQPTSIHNLGVEFDIPKIRTELQVSTNIVTYETFEEANGQSKEFNNDFSLDLGARYHFSENISLFVEVPNLLATDLKRKTHKTGGVTESESEGVARAVLAGLNYTF